MKRKTICYILAGCAAAALALGVFTYSQIKCLNTSTIPSGGSKFK